MNREITKMGITSALAFIVALNFGCSKKEEASPGNLKPNLLVQGVESTPRATPADPVIEARRNGIPGGQVLLPDDPVFDLAEGFLPAEYDLNVESRVLSWTTGDFQSINWNGPKNPGAYELTFRFWRGNPFPTEELEIQYLLPGDTARQTMDTAVGEILLTKRIELSEPSEPLHAEFMIPSWIPQEHIPGSEDGRELGVYFIEATLRPVDESAEAESDEDATSLTTE